MSTTTKKHRDFVSESMGDKPITAIAGVGEAAAEKLSKKGFEKVSGTELTMKIL